MDRSELGRALKGYSIDTSMPESHRYLAGLLEEALALLTLPETGNVLPLLPRTVAAALDGVVDDNDPGAIKWRTALEGLIGRPFTNPARLAGAADDALKMGRVIGEIFEQVTNGVVKASEIAIPLQAAWYLADNYAGEFFASSVYGELYALHLAEAVGTFGNVRLHFRHEHNRTILNFSVMEGEVTFISLGVGSGVLFSANGSFTPDAITKIAKTVMRYWSEDLLTAI